MSTEYQVAYQFPGQALARFLSDWISMRMQWFVNGVGTLEITMPLETYLNFFLPGANFPLRDMQFYIYRAVDGGDFALLFDTLWLAQSYQFDRTTNLLTIQAQTLNTLLRRRIVAAYPGTDEASKYGPADDLIHEVVEEQFTNGGIRNIPGRNWSSILDFGTSAGGGVVIKRSFAYDNVWDVCTRMCQDSWEQGTWLGFDLVAGATISAKPILTTYVNQRGTDRTASIVLSAFRGNIDQINTSIDFSRQVSIAYAGGPGEGRYRQIEAAVNSFISGQYDEIETFKSATQRRGVIAIAGEALAMLREQRLYTSLDCRILDVPGSRYGVDIFHGDLVTYYDEIFDLTYIGRVDGVTITVDANGDEVELDMEITEVS